MTKREALTNQKEMKQLTINPDNVIYYSPQYVKGWGDGVKAQYEADVNSLSSGEWIGIEYDGYANGVPVYDVYECSVCGNEIRTEDPPKYCCDCGSRNEVKYEFEG